MLLQARNGFSLVELLVVVAIIALLLVLIVPGVRSLLDRGSSAQSAANMRQIGAAAGFWMAEWGRLPPYRIQDQDYAQKTLGGPGQSWTDYRILGQYLANTREWSSDGIVAKSSALFSAGDREPNPFEYDLEPGYAITSYGMNTLLSGELTAQRISAGSTLRNFGYPVGSINAPRTILVIEAHMNGWNAGYGDTPPCYGMPEPIGGGSWSIGAPNSYVNWAMRHSDQQGANVLFVDGHVEFVVGDELRERVATRTYLVRPAN